MENPERVTYFAATDSRGKHIPFGIKTKDRDRHMYIIGKTGMGKSTVLENMAIQDIRNGEGIAFIDPHGGTVDRLLDYIPENRINDVVYFAPFDLDHPIAFNVMEDVGYDKRHLVVSGLMATFKKIWVDAWSSRMEYILTNTLLALLEYPDATLLGVNRMYTDKVYRQKVVENIKDPVVKDFWTKEFAVYTDRYTQEATPAIQNKVGQFTGNPLIRNIIGQPKSSFDIRTMMDEKKILIMNLSKGLVGETNMRLLGSMLTTRIFLAAMSRADLSADQLRKLPACYFYVDEFQNFANETFAEILSEARKYKLNLVIAHQYIEQMEEEVRDAVFGNVGTTISFRVGPFDAEVLETIFMPRFTKEDIVSLDKRQIYLSLMIDGVGSAPFSAVTIPPIEMPPVSYRQQVIEASRAQFTKPRAGIESSIIEDLASTSPPPAPPRAAQGTRPPVRPASPVRRPIDLVVSSDRPPHPQTSRPPAKQFPDANTLPKPPEHLPTQKSAEDLRAILRSMTAKSALEQQQKQQHKKSSLQNTLVNVITKDGATNDTKPAIPPFPPKKQVVAPQHAEFKPPPAVSPPRYSEAPKANPPTPEANRATSSEKPFEVPEEDLRKVLRGDG